MVVFGAVNSRIEGFQMRRVKPAELNYLPSAPLQIMLTNPWAKAAGAQPEHACEFTRNPVKI